LFSGFVADEGFGVLVPVVDPGGDIGGEFGDVAMGAALQLFGGER
jgi:hypothetical protein